MRRALDKKPEVKIPPGRQKRIYEDNIKINLKDVRWKGVEWINLAWD